MNEHEERPKTSQKQIEANRRNAHKSTGPSDEGKASRHNAVKHGMKPRSFLTKTLRSVNYCAKVSMRRTTPSAQRNASW